jgi:hypothetical protein
VGIVRVNDVETARAHDFSQQARAAGANASRRNGVNGETFRECALFEGAAAESEEFHVVAARAQSPQREEDLILAAAPVRARINVDGRNRHGDASAAPMNAGVYHPRFQASRRGERRRVSSRAVQ